MLQIRCASIRITDVTHYTSITGNDLCMYGFLTDRLNFNIISGTLSLCNKGASEAHRLGCQLSRSPVSAFFGLFRIQFENGYNAIKS